MREDAKTNVGMAGHGMAWHGVAKNILLWEDLSTGDADC